MHASPVESGTSPAEPTQLACALVFNAIDPSGAAGLTANQLAMASMGVHMTPIATGAYLGDSRSVQDFFPLDEEAIAEQARAVLEDSDVAILMLGFAGNPDNLASVASLASDYDSLPLVTCMPALPWMDEPALEAYWDASKQLILPLTTVLVGSHTTLWRWLMPERDVSRMPQPLDLARIAQSHGVAYTIVTGITRPDGHLANLLAHEGVTIAERVVARQSASFAGAAETFAAALTALLATGSALNDAFEEGLDYLEQSLCAGYRPGMGHVIPDRLFWAQAPRSDEAGDGDDAADTAAHDPTWENHHHETKH